MSNKTERKIMSPREAAKRASRKGNPFSSDEASNLFKSIGTAARESKGQKTSFDFESYEADLTKLVTQNDKKIMKEKLKPHWGLRMIFSENEIDPHGLNPRTRSLIKVTITPTR